MDPWRAALRAPVLSVEPLRWAIGIGTPPAPPLRERAMSAGERPDGIMFWKSLRFGFGLPSELTVENEPLRSPR